MSDYDRHQQNFKKQTGLDWAGDIFNMHPYAKNRVDGEYIVSSGRLITIHNEPFGMMRRGLWSHVHLRHYYDRVLLKSVFIMPRLLFLAHTQNVELELRYPSGCMHQAKWKDGRLFISEFNTAQEHKVTVILTAGELDILIEQMQHLAKYDPLPDDDEEFAEEGGAAINDSWAFKKITLWPRHENELAGEGLLLE